MCGVLKSRTGKVAVQRAPISEGADLCACSLVACAQGLKYTGTDDIDFGQKTCDMETLAYEERLTRRAHWMIRLRWGAVAWTFVATFVANRLWGVPDQALALYAVAVVLVIENVACLWFLQRGSGETRVSRPDSVRRNIHCQICLDLVLLTVLLHFSGGMENPFVVCFFFHMVIASTLLSVRESYAFAAFAVFLLASLCGLEYWGVIPHHCLEGVLASGFHGDGRYVLGSLGVMSGTLFLVVYMTTDIASKLRHQEEAHRLANVELQQKDRIKNEYVGCVTHDIKGHLAAIQSCQDVIMRGLVGDLNEPQQDFIGRAYQRTASLTRFVRALISLTEMRLTDHLEVAAFSLNEAMEQAVHMTDGRARNKVVTLANQGISPAVEVMGNQMIIEEAITNLLQNSIKYTPAGGRIDLTAQVQGDMISVEVRDTGIGIPKDEVPRVFDEFFRGTNAKTLEKHGTGLGLSLVRQIVERHGGAVQLDSEEGTGTRIRFTLPVAKPEESGQPEAH